MAPVVGADVELVADSDRRRTRGPRSRGWKTSELGAGLVGVEVAVLAREGARRSDEHVFLRLRLIDERVEGLVGLVEDEDVGSGRGPQDVPVDLLRPQGRVVDLGVEDGLVVVGPGRIPGREGDRVGKRLAGRQVLEVEGVRPAADRIDGVGQEVLSGLTDRPATEK